jgi:bis(5'-nucleosyl)-tetraphosphatase (symmetrical)
VELTFFARTMNYLIGDIQGCCDAFERLLTHIDFSPSRDHLYVLGDLINRGPASLATLQRLHGLGASVSCVLGNHDLHFLAVSQGARERGRHDTLAELLACPERTALIDWLRAQQLAIFAHGWLMVHAGVVPQWRLEDVLEMARAIEARLRGPDWVDFLRVMYGNQPQRWDASLAGDARLRFGVNVLTRIRYCKADGSLEMALKDGQAEVPGGLYRWFEAPERLSQNTPIAFGHWSTLGLIQRSDLLALDTGCVWGGKLTAARIFEGGSALFQVGCVQALRPG